jgi:Mrp family chromosome partitioning ATPase
MPNQDSGLTDLLRNGNGVNVESAIRETAVPGLWVLPSGTGKDGIPRLLYATNLSALLERFRSEFDLVLVDSPPMGLLTDARLLGRLSDGVVLVVRANRARTDALRATCMRLLQDGIPVLGTILNDCRLDGSNLRTYSQYYRHYGTARGA